MNYNDLTKEELIKLIEENENISGKYGLVWDKEKEPEQVVVECDKYIPILTEKKDKNIINKEVDNILIEGDNFHALSVLNYTHKENIDIIYIDPPYNTGNNDFMYNDKYIDPEDGYRHSKWLNFMEKRLKIARELLKENGVMFISIDDNEYAQLRLLCDKIFGSSNNIGVYIKQSKVGGGNDSKFIVKEHEYCLVYAKKISKCYEMFVKHDDEYMKRYKEEDENGRYFWDTFARPGLKHPIVYEITAPDGTIIKNGWIHSKERFDKEKEEGKIKITKNRKGEWTVFFKQYLNLNGKKPRSMTMDFGGSIDGKKDLAELFDDEKVFLYPKSVDYIKTLISTIKVDNPIILDFFAGSGTTGQAVLELNKEDQGNRKFILCTNNENNICEDITYERVKRAIEGYEKFKPLGGNLRYFKTDFVQNIGTRDQLYYDLTEKCIPMLCVKSDTYELVEKNKEYAIYSNDDRTEYSCVYFDIFGDNYQEFLNKIKGINEHKNLYIFSLSEYINEENFKGVTNYNIEPIPYKILDLYKNVVKMSKEN